MPLLIVVWQHANLAEKKKDKFHITVGLACNSDGSEKLEPIFIGKASKPRCFKKQSPEQCGFYYWNNSKAWMTSSLFEEYVLVSPVVQSDTDLSSEQMAQET